jgi:hypothetical protein
MTPNCHGTFALARRFSSPVMPITPTEESLNSALLPEPLRLAGVVVTVAPHAD